MAELKTKKIEEDVESFLNSLENEQKRADSYKILELVEKATGLTPRMCGKTMIGFGKYHYKYDSGREGDGFLTGFSPRKQNLTIYIMPGFAPYSDLMDKIGKHKLGKSCLYVNKLADIDLKILENLVKKSVNDMNRKYNDT